MDLHNEILSLVPRKKMSPNGWMSFNAPCCIYNGESKDTKRRGGLTRTSDNGVTYHCFNCGWKASWRPGRNLGMRMRDLLKWLGANDDQINFLAFECLKIQPDTTSSDKKLLSINFEPRSMPKDSVMITEELAASNTQVAEALAYIRSRGLTLDDNDFYWSETLKDRFIVPLTVDKNTVGYIARKCGKGNPRYLTEHPPHVVFNLDKQDYENQFLLVFEGCIDAILLGGVAVLTNEISNEQAQQISSLNKQIIVVPDRDKAGESMVNRAIALGWSVAFPLWADDIKDAADAVNRYGRLATLISIVKNIEQNELKIRLRMKM